MPLFSLVIYGSLGSVELARSLSIRATFAEIKNSKTARQASALTSSTLCGGKIEFSETCHEANSLATCNSLRLSSRPRRWEKQSTRVFRRLFRFLPERQLRCDTHSEWMFWVISCGSPLIRVTRGESDIECVVDVTSVIGWIRKSF